MKKILLLEPDKEQASVFTDWLKEAGYDVNVAEAAEGVLSLLSADEFKSIIVDMDALDQAMGLYQAIRKDTRFWGIPVFMLVYKTKTKEIAEMINTSVDGLLFKPFETEDFLSRLKFLSEEAEQGRRGKKILDRNYINSLIKLTGEVSREDFFLLAPPIFNMLILDKIKSYLGEPVIAQMIKRCDELIGEDYPFMREIKFRDNRIFMDGVDRASRDVPVNSLALAFRDYTYAFLQLVQTLTSNILMERGKL